VTEIDRRVPAVHDRHDVEVAGIPRAHVDQRASRRIEQRHLDPHGLALHRLRQGEGNRRRLHACEREADLREVAPAFLDRIDLAEAADAENRSRR
jgi:hypothetical protein